MFIKRSNWDSGDINIERIRWGYQSGLGSHIPTNTFNNIKQRTPQCLRAEGICKDRERPASAACAASCYTVRSAGDAGLQLGNVKRQSSVTACSVTHGTQIILSGQKTKLRTERSPGGPGASKLPPSVAIKKGEAKGSHMQKGRTHSPCFKPH